MVIIITVEKSLECGFENFWIWPREMPFGYGIQALGEGVN